MKVHMLQARRRARVEAKAKAFDKIKAIVEAADQDGVLARIRDVINEIQQEDK
jgi:hypothetical protein